MVKRKKELLSLLLLAGVITFSANGCSKISNSKVKRVLDENNNITYTGEIYDSELEYLYIFEIENVNNNKELYLTRLNTGFNYYLFGTDVVIGNKFLRIQSNDPYEINSDYGKVTNVYEFKQFVPIYSKINNIYTAEEINKIFEKVKDDYNQLKDNNNIKKLELINK